MYYCDPPLHADVGFDMGTASRFWRVTSNQCHSPGPGLYTSWRSALAICAGIQDVEPVFHETVALALPSWYECCHMGQHAHPIDPMVVSPSRQSPGAPSPGQAYSSTQYAIGADRAAAPTMPMATRTAPAAVESARPSPTTTLLGSPAQVSDADLQAGSALSFAVRGGEVVYSDIGPAIQHFEQVRSTHGAAELMGTHNYFKAFFFASGMDEANADQLGHLHIGLRSVSAHSSDFVQGFPVGREPVTPTPLPRDASAVVKPGPSRVTSRTVEAVPPEKKQALLARLVAIQGSLLKRTQQQKKAKAAKQGKPAVLKQEKPVVVKQETPGTVLSKGKAKAEAGYEGDDFYVDDDDNFAHLVENWTPEVDTYIHQGQPPYEERFDPHFENQPGDNL
ncbi:hypothetical protein B0H13DRAFT_2352714 [Mycena leptocephala]|nr:hypothetical protein B0H13DRAFT_2352714 [Mycena leptocephala]